jgi:hypothetical protein
LTILTRYQDHPQTWEPNSHEPLVKNHPHHPRIIISMPNRHHRGAFSAFHRRGGTRHHHPHPPRPSPQETCSPAEKDVYFFNKK